VPVVAVTGVFVLVFFVLGGLDGPGTVAAGIEYPFNQGPWGSVGRYCPSLAAFLTDYENYAATPSALCLGER
jgi:hypothetical protein